MKCPDCGYRLDKVIVEVCKRSLFSIDHRKKEVEIRQDIWDYDDHMFHCPKCDSLNVDYLLKDYTVIF